MGAATSKPSMRCFRPADPAVERRPVDKLGGLLRPASAAIIGVSDSKRNMGRIILGNMLAGDGEYAEAIRHYRRYLALEPDGPMADRARELFTELEFRGLLREFGGEMTTIDRSRYRLVTSEAELAEFRLRVDELYRIDDSKMDRQEKSYNLGYYLLTGQSEAVELGQLVDEQQWSYEG